LSATEFAQNAHNGKYTLEFALEDKFFRRSLFPFQQSKAKTSTIPKYFIARWDVADLRTLYAPRIDRFIQLNIWLRDTKNLGAFDPDPVQYGVKLIREKDKQVLAEGSEKIVLAYNWQAYQVHFNKPNFEQTKIIRNLSSAK